METLSREEKIKHCAAALKTADIIFELAAPFAAELSLEDHRDDEPNPLYHQTAEGLLLEFWGSRPVAVVTPWGKYCFGGWFNFTIRDRGEHLAWKKIFPQLKSQLCLVLYKPKSEIKTDTIHGDLWAIRNPMELPIELPDSIERGYSSFESADAALKEWAELVEQIRKSVSI